MSFHTLLSSLFGIFMLCACGGGYERPQFAEHALPQHQSLLGTADPYTLESVARDGSYIVLCQARADTNRDGRIRVSLGYHGDTDGDRLEPYFIREKGPGERFDELIDLSGDDGFVLAVRRPDLRLVDTKTGNSIALHDADVDNRIIEARLLDPRPAAQAVFGREGGKIAYKKRNTEQIVITVHDLSTHREKDIQAGTGALGTFFFDPSEQWLILQKATEDSDKNGRIEFPSMWTTLAPAACRGPVSSFSVRPGRGDEAKWWAVHIESAKLSEAPEGWINMLGESALVREADESLAAISIDGTKTTLVSSECAAGVRWAADNPRRLLVACAKTGTIEWIGPEGRQVLRSMKKVPKGDVLRWEKGPLVKWSEGNQEFFIDIERKQVIEFKPGEYSVGSFGRRILLNDNNTLVFFDSESGERRPLPIPTLQKDIFIEWKSGPIIAIAGYIIDLEQGRISGRYPAPILGVDSRGRILKAANIYLSGFELPRGPLFWDSPSALPSETQPAAPGRRP